MKHLARALFRWLAKRILKKYQPMVVGVAGSVGKTAAKEAIAVAAASKQRTVRKTIGSFNAEIGVPTTIISGGAARKSPAAWIGVGMQGLLLVLAKKVYPDVLVLELGADKPGDLEPLIELARPTIGVLTAMTAEHLEFFADLEGVEAEESRMVTSLPAGGIAVVNIDDERIANIVPRLESKIITFGWSPTATIQALGMSIIQNTHGVPSGMVVKISLHGTVVSIPLPGVLGKHQAYPILAAIGVATALGDDITDIVPRLSGYRPPTHRMAVAEGINGSLIIDDSYNASPAAMRAALETLYDLKIPGKKFAILGQMSELGASAVAAHVEVGKLFDPRRLHQVAIIGPFGPQIREGAQAAGFPLAHIHDVATPEAAAAFFQSSIQSGDAILVKGSRYPKPKYAGHLERAVNILLERRD